MKNMENRETGKISQKVVQKHPGCGIMAMPRTRRLPERSSL